MESMEYEEVRNHTLLFFFERLIDKNEPRTLHDLSCQFGAPGFSKEMRQIAGGSESGELEMFMTNFVLICGQATQTRPNDEDVKANKLSMSTEFF